MNDPHRYLTILLSVQRWADLHPRHKLGIITACDVSRSGHAASLTVGLFVLDAVAGLAILIMCVAGHRSGMLDVPAVFLVGVAAGA
jgi:hypothetical protein